MKKRIVVIAVVVVVIGAMVAGVVAQPYRIHAAYIDDVEVFPRSFRIHTAYIDRVGIDYIDRVRIDAGLDEAMPLLPVQYRLRVVAGGPTTCWRPWKYCVMRFGKVIFVRVLTLHHRYGACGQAYTWEEKTIGLGTCFIPGTKYTVVVNDVVKTFVAIGGGSDKE